MKFNFNTLGGLLRSGGSQSSQIALARRLSLPMLLGQSAIPFISLSTGSISAPGAISAITALPVVFPHAYCYFPANILATAIVAGWHYCTFSSSTAGTAFLNTYAGTGVPTIPAAPTAVTDGKGAFTGDITEEFGPTVTIPANAMGANGGLRYTSLWTYTNSAGAKTARVRYSGNAGTQYLNTGNTTTLTMHHILTINNRGVTNSQVGGFNSTQPWSAVAGAAVVSAADTTAATSLVASLQKAVATDNLILERWTAELLPA